MQDKLTEELVEDGHTEASSQLIVGTAEQSQIETTAVIATSDIEIGYESSRRLWLYVWSILAVFFAALTIFGYACRSGVHNTPYPFLIFLLALSAGCAVGAILIARSVRPPVWLKLSNSGIEFSGVWAAELQNRMSRDWSDVRVMYLTGFVGTKFLNHINWNSINYVSATPQLQILFSSGGSTISSCPCLIGSKQACC